MLKQLTLAVGLLAATAVCASEKADTYLLIAVSDTDSNYVFDADLSRNDCEVEMRSFDLKAALGVLKDNGQLAPVEFVDVYCVMDDGGDF